jgi:integrase
MPKLTTAIVRNLTTPGKHSDGSGLLLHILPDGRRYWSYRFQRQGRERTMSLGSVDDISLADARRLHAKQRAILLGGSDPLAERERNKQEQRRQTHTFAAVAEATIAAREPGWRGQHLAQHWRQSLRDHVLPKIGNKPVAEIDVADVPKVLKPLWTTKTHTGCKVRMRMEAILDYATAMGWRSGQNPAVWRGGLRSLLPASAKVHATTHHPALDWRESPALMAKLRERADGMGMLATQFVIFTVCRNAEVRGATWDEIDLEQKLWTVPAARMKAAKPHRVPLSEPALDVLRGLPRTESPYVFLGMRPMRPLSDETMKLGLRRLGYPDISVHGMRSMFRDWCADTGKPGDLAEAVLAHVTGNSTVQAYARSDMLERRRALMDQWAQFLTQPPAQVVRLRAAG